MTARSRAMNRQPVPNEAVHRPDGTTVIRIQRKDGTVLDCIVDTADYETVAPYRWRAQKGQHTFYVRTMVRGPDGAKRALSIHDLILPGATIVERTPLFRDWTELGGSPAIAVSDGAAISVLRCVDHENHDGLDNRRANLRPADLCENAMNRQKHQPAGCTSSFKGVRRSKRGRQFSVQITARKETFRAGPFRTEVDAACAYNTLAKQLHGTYARLNDVPETDDLLEVPVRRVVRSFRCEQQLNEFLNEIELIDPDADDFLEGL